MTPTPEQVQAAREWLRANVRPAPRLTSSDRENWRGRTLSQREDAAVQLATLIATREAAVAEWCAKVADACWTQNESLGTGSAGQQAACHAAESIAAAIRALGREP